MPPAPNSTGPSVCCVLVNWNGWHDTVSCLMSLVAQTHGALHVVVVDNGSTDDSIAQIRAAIAGLPSLRAEVVEAGGNLGFATGTNVGIRAGMAQGADFFWLLNNDTVAPPETLSMLLQAATARVGIVGSVLYYAHDPGRVQAWGGGRIRATTAFSTHFTSPHRLTADCYLTFASVLIPREVVTKVGLLYEGFFMYFEDADYSLRVRRAGYKLAVADTAILHAEGASAGSGRNRFLEQVITVSGLRLIERNATSVPAMHLGRLIFVLRRVLKRLLTGDVAGTGAVWRGVLQYRAEKGRSFTDKV